ncbi:MAG: T9SS type A sorting domain-containing protein [Flavobacteriales bacterium]
MKMILPTYNEKKRTGFRLSVCDMAARPLLIAVLPFLSWSWATAQTSVYHPFPDSNAVWGMIAGCTDWNCGTYRYVQYYMAGDTVIDGNGYKIIDQSVSSDYESCSCGIPGDVGEGFLRENLVTRKVYWRFPGSTADTLLYDFTLELGDTLRGLYGNTGLCSQAIFTVQSIDSVLVGSGYRRRVNFSDIDIAPCNPTSIIEGVGATTGLTSCYAGPTSFGIRLECFTVGDSLFYSALCGPDLAACGELPLGIAANGQSRKPDVAALPNPSIGLFHFGQAVEQIIVYNAQGKLLFQQHGKDVDLSAFPPGLYHAVVRTAQGVGHVRLLVQR